MKARDSGMPEEQMWATFFDAPRMLAALGFADPKGNVADFGCGKLSVHWRPVVSLLSCIGFTTIPRHVAPT